LALIVLAIFRLIERWPYQIIWQILKDFVPVNDCKSLGLAIPILESFISMFKSIQKNEYKVKKILFMQFSFQKSYINENKLLDFLL